MSLITSCPACGTMFRVVPDQLKISEGWVRCGHCGEVFDATAHLRDETDVELAQREGQGRPAQMATPPAALPDSPVEVPATIPAELATRPAELYAAPPERARPSDAGVPSSSFFGPDSQSLEPSPLDSPFVFRRSDLVEPGDSALPPAPRDSQLRAEADEAAADLEAMSFVRNARRKVFWRRPLVRMFLVLVSFALAALLALQLAYQDRDRLARAEPALRPYLQRMCELLRCTLGPPRQIEAIVIDSSGFNRLRNDTYRLSFTLRNTSRVEVAVPAMELTVTDAQDQPLARRVLMPSEFGGGGEVIPPVTDWSRTVGLTVSTPATGRVAGYRLLAFYP